MMLKLHANVYVVPSDLSKGPEVILRGQSFPTICGLNSGPPLFVETLPVTFEAMQQSLSQLEQCDYEPDGYFLVSGNQSSSFWRLNGHMHELNEKMHRVELNGECPAEVFDSVLVTMGWPSVELVFELVQEGVTLREADFRQWASID